MVHMAERKASQLVEHRIRNHGIIGDTYSAALVTMKGTIDWCSFPRMDSPPVFSSLLDPERGGRFDLRLRGATEYDQHYRKDTNVLRTIMKSADCTLLVDDFMPVEEVEGIPYTRHEIHRLLSCTRGNGNVYMNLRPKFDFCRARTTLRTDRFGCIASGGGDKLSLSLPYPLKVSLKEATGIFRMKKGESIPVVLRWNEDKTQLPKLDYTGKMLNDTVTYWRRWVKETKYVGMWRDQVIRSALVLKLLTYTPTGAICAAATTSLPESIGHERNWDYRFSWVRDSTYALLSFNALGHTDEERAYFLWLMHLLRGNASKPELLRVMYTIEGDEVPDEKTVPGLAGYRGSLPVREGNSATGQLQLDIYGSIVDTIHSTFKPPGKFPDLMWRIVDSIASFIAKNWEKKDMGIWEMRNGVDRHTHSALLSWVALSKASEIAGWLGFRGRRQKYADAAKRVRETVLSRSYNERLKAFSSSIDGGYLDASVLLMPLLDFIDAKDDKFLSTLNAVKEHLLNQGFVYRYKGKDGLAGKEGAFLICTFWYIASLARAGRGDEAKQLFEHALSDANHLGLFSEEINPLTGEFLGNFPQAFSHMGLIDAAREISEALKDRSA